jgi:DNA-binding transcriptional regulator YiaG
MCYWSGYAVARLQYASGLSFYELNKLVPIQDVFEMYHILHEADIQKFVDMALERIKRKKTETNLKAIRRASGLTQRELSERANVDLRSIQMYEQRRNDINKAQADTLHNLAKALGCKIEDLLERF